MVFGYRIIELDNKSMHVEFLREKINMIVSNFIVYMTINTYFRYI